MNEQGMDRQTDEPKNDKPTNKQTDKHTNFQTCTSM